MRCAVSVTIPACEPVNETAASPRSMMAMHSSAIEMRSPEVSSMSISRAVGSLETSWARRSRSSVVLPMADTTTTTSSPPRRVRTMCSATARIRSGSATDVPPNFCTSRLTTGDCTGTGPDSDASIRAYAICVAVGRLPRRAQGHQTRAPAPEPGRPPAGDGGGGEARSATAPIRNLALLLIPLVILFVILQVTNSDDSDSSPASRSNNAIEARTYAEGARHDHRPGRQRTPR